MKKSLKSPELTAGGPIRPCAAKSIPEDAAESTGEKADKDIAENTDEGSAESMAEVPCTGSASRGGKSVLMSIRDLSFSYPDRPRDTVLSHLDLEIFEGECLAVLGASGSGKTTLLKLLCGLMRPDSGQIRYRDQELRGPSNEIAMIFQNYGLFPWKTVRENVLLPLRLRREHPDREKTDRLLEYLGILPHAEKYPGELSGGQRQRTALGRAVMAEARLILMDEPFSALDIRNREKLRRFMLRLFCDMHMTSILVTHSIEEALCMGDRIAVFDEDRGRIRAIFSNAPEMLETDSEEYYRLLSRIRECL